MLHEAYQMQAMWGKIPFKENDKRPFKKNGKRPFNKMAKDHLRNTFWFKNICV